MAKKKMRCPKCSKVGLPVFMKTLDGKRGLCLACGLQMTWAPDVRK